MNRQLRTRRRDDLLFLGAGELAENGLSDRGWRLDRQRVHEHMRRGSHGGRCLGALTLPPTLDNTRRSWV